MKKSGIAAVFVAAFLTSCGAVDAEQKQDVEVPKAAEPEFIQLKGENVFVMIIPSDADPTMIKAWAKDRCGEVEFCKVFGWTDKASAARALPMTDAEFASQAVSYGVNRATGFEQFSWDCDRYPKTEGVECL